MTILFHVTLMTMLRHFEGVILGLATEGTACEWLFRTGGRICSRRQRSWRTGRFRL